VTIYMMFNEPATRRQSAKAKFSGMLNMPLNKAAGSLFHGAYGGMVRAVKQATENDVEGHVQHA